MPLRTLLVLMALVVVVMAVKRLFFSPRPGAPPRRLKQGKMVQCAHCGIYLPEPEALVRGDRHYCSQAHLEDDQGPASG